MAENKPFAEVIESSLQHFVAQSWQWDHYPAFGSLVTIITKKRTLFGLVYQTQTGSMDPMRHPFPYRKTHEELMAEQPQIFEFLKTTFHCLALGYMQHDKVYHVINPEPAAIHSFVLSVNEQLARQFFNNNRYLTLLFALQNLVTIGIDELLLACLRYQKELKMLDEEKIIALMNTFSLLTGNDYRRMKLLLGRVDTLL